jgi:hypothetical protein
MARYGLSVQECDEILALLQQQYPMVDDDLLVKLADTFRLDAQMDFDPNDLIALLNQADAVAFGEEAFAGEYCLADVMEKLRSRLMSEKADQVVYAGGLLILRCPATNLKSLWGSPIAQMMSRFKEPMAAMAPVVFGVLVDNHISCRFELQMLLKLAPVSTSQKA